MSCQEFLARYSEYLDDRLEPLEAALWRAHAERCSSCARYDRVLRRGLELVRDLPQVEPSADFSPRLHHRLYHADDGPEMGHRASGASAVVSLAIAGVLAVVAWSPLVRPGPLTVELAPMDALAPVPASGTVLPVGQGVPERIVPGWAEPVGAGFDGFVRGGGFGGVWWATTEPSRRDVAVPAFLGGQVWQTQTPGLEPVVPMEGTAVWAETGARRRAAWTPVAGDPE